MSNFTFDQATIDKALGMALLDSVQLLEEEILKITPRDPRRPPKDPSRRITGNLKRSIGYQQVGEFEYIIGTKQAEAEYWKYLEFWTPRMAPRSFLRKGIIDSKDLVLKNFAKIFKKALGQ